MIDQNKFFYYEIFSTLNSQYEPVHTFVIYSRDALTELMTIRIQENEEFSIPTTFHAACSYFTKEERGAIRAFFDKEYCLREARMTSIEYMREIAKDGHCKLKYSKNYGQMTFGQDIDFQMMAEMSE